MPSQLQSLSKVPSSLLHLRYPRDRCQVSHQPLTSSRLSNTLLDLSFISPFARDLTSLMLYRPSLNSIPIRFLIISLLQSMSYVTSKVRAISASTMGVQGPTRDCTHSRMPIGQHLLKTVSQSLDSYGFSLEGQLFGSRGSRKPSRCRPPSPNIWR